MRPARLSPPGAARVGICLPAVFSATLAGAGWADCGPPHCRHAEQRFRIWGPEAVHHFAPARCGDCTVFGPPVAALCAMVAKALCSAAHQSGGLAVAV